MKDRHPVITKWVTKLARANAAFKAGKGRYVDGFNNLHYRQHRILSRIFFSVEEHGVVPGSLRFCEFHFEYQRTVTRTWIGPLDPNARKHTSNLRFVIVDPTVDDSIPYAEWCEDAGLRLEDRVPEIVQAVVCAARAVAHIHRERARSSLEEELLAVLDRLRELDAPVADGFAARCDPRSIQTLVDMAEQHREAIQVRRFLCRLSKTIADGSVVVADRSINDWIAWATAKMNEHDPLVQGPQYVIERLLKI